jgi:hypothetical protein
VTSPCLACCIIGAGHLRAGVANQRLSILCGFALKAEVLEMICASFEKKTVRQPGVNCRRGEILGYSTRVCVTLSIFLALLRYGTPYVDFFSGYSFPRWVEHRARPDIVPSPDDGSIH